ncbi:MAG: NADH-quinone oxidoreductase subunit A [Armatimonadota bacterium]|nr:NADH-quinone oxidoreductase subunit A [Armatimonadota bacterium]MDR5698192.1 NADH-quinone oxidoreductase subunit A [Armatimonadota bacterium]
MAALPLAIVWLIAPRSQYPQKLLAYESGIVPFGEAWSQVNIRYYLFALIFLLFDVEVMYIYPWAVVLRSLGMQAFVAMAIFLVLLFVGLLYEWKKGALEWV